MVFIQAVKDYLDYVQITKSDGTFRFEKTKAITISSYFHDYQKTSISNKDIIKFITYLKNRNPNISSATINKYLAVLRRIFIYSYDFEISFQKLKETKKIIKTIEHQIITKVFNYLKRHLSTKNGYRNYVMFKLLLDTGLRINELLNLKVTDINFEENVIHVKITKTKNERYVFFTSSTSKIVQKYITKCLIKTYLFIDFTKNKRLGVDPVQSVCYRIEQKLELENTIRPHKWRHTFATNYLKNGGTIAVLQLIMGHSSIKTTERYIHLDKDYLKNEYIKVNK